MPSFRRLSGEGQRGCLMMMLSGAPAVSLLLSGQTHYVHEASGKRSFTLPGSQPESPSSSSEQQQGRQGRQSDAERGASAAGSARGRY